MHNETDYEKFRPTNIPISGRRNLLISRRRKIKSVGRNFSLSGPVNKSRHHTTRPERKAHKIHKQGPFICLFVFYIRLNTAHHDNKKI